MHKTGPRGTLQLGDIPVALSLLTRLPIRLEPEAYGRGARTTWAWPLVGAVVAMLAAILAKIVLTLGLPAPIAALLALSLMVIVTGAMHEDGLADVADGFWGGPDRARRLEIMKDSRIGAYGVIALILSLGLRGLALVSLGAALIPGLFVSALLSRAAMAHVMQALPNARDTGLSHSTGRPGTAAVALAAGISGFLALLISGWAGVWAILATLVAMLACAAIARAKIGGQTGDVLGATQQITEIAVLLALLATM
ncbi:adenosylcobinamide-GDP ribazoletransferase [Alisedimentitalea sp. MJ-SS2]|uniref:adenosylcobinamide-GDP ribazoletransferase n=1 Tax=Aliisedimentitalea sp. MJ-SS2 TaxID=3049795 RepID=UPI00290A4B44|nr:adenosylcobinamide-GDP ribazoletransferase [Alisedimentitalea sp. MJ-SS2]MDU8927498.1 adenosylcobinamide-GDP ribazoletransferase [Alisedimentitalea sp. MJ-SS2]